MNATVFIMSRLNDPSHFTSLNLKYVFAYAYVSYNINNIHISEFLQQATCKQIHFSS